MKSITLLLFALFMASTNFAQSKKNIFFDQQTQITKFHTIDELEDLKKGQLIKLYTDRANEIITIIPYLALSNEPGVSLGDIGIKENSDNLKILGKHHETTTDAFESTSNLISEFIPYADTEQIIWSILYFEEIIKKIRIGANGNF
ncbi:hypothetical protein [Aquimarina sp. 2201CG5-10]|uniref:hypothetical protein n=1 Tax=Aquimarina callyspongiae TaxID=3098150 RepID=UPI002AB5649B|nr:hypothetical protein [Aquimarina sp. 2201CG5-10]MDY8136647.1 hypothetical protein [Aquimarina sp. 2201CG5-10]